MPRDNKGRFIKADIRLKGDPAKIQQEWDAKASDALDPFRQGRVANKAVFDQALDTKAAVDAAVAQAESDVRECLHTACRERVSRAIRDEMKQLYATPELAQQAMAAAIMEVV